MTNRIKVIDSPTGSGKTTYIMNYINQAPPEKKFIVITPLLDEVDRYIRECPDRNFVQPQTIWGVRNKTDHLEELVAKGCNIVSTHALLQRITDELVTLLRNSNYTLILDEAFQVVDQFNLYPEKSKAAENEELTREDVKWLFDDHYIDVDDNYQIIWVDEKRGVGNKYSQLKSLIDRGMIYLVNDSLFLWTFPYELFYDGIFDECFILTYMFESQFQCYYYKYFGIEYDQYHIETIDGCYVMIPTTDHQYEIEFIQRAKSLITIVDNESLNKIGSFYRGINGKTKTTDLCLNWYRKNPKLLKQLNSNLYNFFRNSAYVPMEERLWTTFKEYRKKLNNPMTGRKDATKSAKTPEDKEAETAKNQKVTFLDCSARATNTYRHKNALAYLINQYPNTFYVAFFRKKGIVIDNDRYALGNLIQWIWRSAIRDGKPIVLYLPSQRMRTILQEFLNGSPVISSFEDAEYEE